MDIKYNQIIWVENIQLYRDNCIHRLKIENNFCIYDLTYENLALYKNREKVMKRISDKLYYLKVPSDYNNAVEFFSESFIQQMFIECYY